MVPAFSSEVDAVCIPRAGHCTSPRLMSGISIMFKSILSPCSMLGRIHAILLIFQRAIILTHFIDLRIAFQSTNRKELH